MTDIREGFNERFFVCVCWGGGGGGGYCHLSLI